MGSLLSGWDSHVPDPKTVKFQRNKSLTKEEIATYWRSKKLALAHEDFQENTGEESDDVEKKYKRSSSLPLASNMKQNLMDSSDSVLLPGHQEERMEKLLHRDGWWISSNWAFLNEPPVITSEAPTYKYASQFHVAGRSCSSRT